MSTQRRTSIIVVGGALAVASVAYGLGTQTGDGTAVADSNGQERERGIGVAFRAGAVCGVAGLADKLGVDEQKLEQALRDYRKSHAYNVRMSFPSDLADALGIPEDKVRAALDKLHGQRERRFDRHFDERGAPPKPPGGPPAMSFHFGMPLRELASELGVKRSELRAALREVGQKAADRVRREGRELAEFLAERLGLDADKVLDALPAGAPPLMSPHLPDHPPAP
jgi:transcriptional regulator with XRE-family HTH domain